jgi:hypothetical protein
LTRPVIDPGFPLYALTVRAVDGFLAGFFFGILLGVILTARD